jgi:hypothetical protein
MHRTSAAALQDANASKPSALSRCCALLRSSHILTFHYASNGRSTFVRQVLCLMCRACAHPTRRALLLLQGLGDDRPSAFPCHPAKLVGERVFTTLDDFEMEMDGTHDVGARVTKFSFGSIAGQGMTPLCAHSRHAAPVVLNLCLSSDCSQPLNTAGDCWQQSPSGWCTRSKILVQHCSA